MPDKVIMDGTFSYNLELEIIMKTRTMNLYQSGKEAKTRMAKMERHNLSGIRFSCKT
jgi:hypothetical protein